ncbi:MAG: undecaprenyl-diphosphate phosphatase [Candidatus Cloacimonetes bacterium]|nr:undecaprenyl-diphosphate phosphatase [Candidatus Cloacimonadota bacterium]
MIDIIKAAILGIIQGLTEFLPISSSGHLILSEHFLNFKMPGVSFEVMLHLGTLFAVLIYFHKDIINIIGAFFTISNDPVFAQRRKVGWLLLVATIVTGIMYFMFKDYLENLFKSGNKLNLYIICIFLGISGFMNIISDKITKNRIEVHKMNFGKAAIIGLGQAFALNPGISRSGSTITFGLLVGLNRKDVATFSFLLAIPAILGATVNEIPKLVNTSKSELQLYLVGAFTAFLTGYLVISVLIKILQQRKMKIFAYWCWLVAIVSAVLITVN